MEEKTKAQRLIEAHQIIDEVEELICDLFAEHEPEVYSELDFAMSTDWYDNSIEIYFKNDLPYPYEPCKTIRDAIYALGFGIVYWNFADGDEIRGDEPRRSKDPNVQKIQTDYGFVDDRFNEEEYLKNQQK